MNITHTKKNIDVKVLMQVFWPDILLLQVKIVYPNLSLLGEFDLTVAYWMFGDRPLKQV